MKNRCNRRNCRTFCLYCIAAWAGLPLEHFFWEHLPYGITFLRLIHVSI